MVRTTPRSDAFLAIAEPRRRAIFELLCSSERAVNDVVEHSRLDQPAVSKHLRVLREAGLVRVRKEGRQRFYSATPEALEPLRAWIAQIEELWDTDLDAIRRIAEQKARDRSNKRGDSR